MFTELLYAFYNIVYLLQIIQEPIKPAETTTLAQVVEKEELLQV